MTVSEQLTYCAQILADTGNIKWQNTTHILPALNSAQEEFVMKVLGYVPRNRRAFEVLSEIQVTTTQSVSTSGYALSGLDSTAPFMRNGLITASLCINDTTFGLRNRVSFETDSAGE